MSVHLLIIDRRIMYGKNYVIAKSSVKKNNTVIASDFNHTANCRTKLSLVRRKLILKVFRMIECDVHS